MAHNPVIWFEIYVQDMNRARKFYETVLQLTLEKIDSPGIEMWGFPMQPDRVGTGGSLVQMTGVPSGGNSTLVYFQCDDCAVEGNRVVDSGGRIYREKTSIGKYGSIVLAYDTEENMFGLHSM